MTSRELATFEPLTLDFPGNAWGMQLAKAWRWLFCIELEKKGAMSSKTVMYWVLPVHWLSLTEPDKAVLVTCLIVCQLGIILGGSRCGRVPICSMSFRPSVRQSLTAFLGVQSKNRQATYAVYSALLI